MNKTEKLEHTASVKIDLSKYPLTDADRERVESEAIAEDCERDTDKEIRFLLEIL